MQKMQKPGNKIKVQKLCHLHDAVINYVCKQKDCQQASHLLCGECILTGPHIQHEFYKLGDYDIKMKKVLKIAKPKADKMQQVQQNRMMQSQPDLQFAAMNGLTNKVFSDIQTQTTDIIQEIQQEFLTQFDQISQKQLKTPILQLYEELDHIQNQIHNPQINALLIPRNQLESIKNIFERPDDYLSDMFDQEQEQQIMKQKKLQNNGQEQNNQQDFLQRANKIVEKKMPGLQGLFIEFLEQTARPYIKSILNEIEFSDEIASQQRMLPFNFQKYEQQCVAELPVHESGTTEFCRIDQNIIASASHEKLIKIWNVNTQKIIKIINDNVGGSIISVIKVGDTLISSGYDKCFRFHSIKENYSLRGVTQNIHDDCVISLKQLNKKYFASASDDKTIKIWSFNEFSKQAPAKLEHTFEGHTDCVKALCTVGCDLLVSGGSDNIIKVWDWQEQKFLRDLHGHKDWIRCITSLSTSEAASGGNDFSIIIWNVREGKMLRHIQGAHSGSSVCSMITLGEQWILSSSFGGRGKLVLTNWRNGESVKSTISGNAGFHSLVQMSEQCMVQGMGDGTVKIFK